MTKHEGMTKDEARTLALEHSQTCPAAQAVWSFGIRHSFVIWHSSLVIPRRRHEAGADRLLIAAYETDICGREAALSYSVAGRDALPGSGGHEALAQNALEAQTWAGPVLPRRRFGSVGPRTAAQAVAEQVGVDRLELLPHSQRRVRARQAG